MAGNGNSGDRRRLKALVSSFRFQVSWAHRLLGYEGATRVDMRYKEPGQFYVLEVNSLPGMTSLSLLPEIARGAGIDFPDLVERILIGARLKIPLTTQGMNSMPTSG